MNRMALQILLQCDQRSVAVPESHMLDVWHQRKLAPGTKSPSLRAVPAGVLPPRLTSSAAPQSISVGTFTCGALPRVSQVRRAS